MANNVSAAIVPLTWLRRGIDLLVLMLISGLFAIWLARYSIPDSEFVRATEQWFGSDTNMHASFGFLLTLSIGWLLRLWRRSSQQQLLLFVLIVLTFGLDELAQYFFRTRSVSLDDFLMSLAGWVLALLCWFSCKYLLHGRINR